MNGTVLANRSAVDRNTTDFYRTPPEVTVALLNFLEEHGCIRPRSGSVIWEPACGSGEMVEAMKGKGYSVIFSDLYPTGYGGVSLPRDFLEEKPMLYDFDWIITNPPFCQAEKFIRRALELGKPFAFLLKSQFWHARSRLALYREHPPTYVLPLTWRPDFLWGAKAGSPTMEVLWTVWNGDDFVTGYVPLERPKLGNKTRKEAEIHEGRTH